MKEKSKKTRYIFAKIVAALGMLINGFILYMTYYFRKEKLTSHEFYKNKVIEFNDNKWSYYADRNLVAYDFLFYVMVFIGICIASYLLIMLLHKFYFPFLIIPLGEVVMWYMTYIYMGKYGGNIPFMITIGAAITMFLLAMATVISKKLRLIIPVTVIAFGYAVMDLYYFREIDIYYFAALNIFGSMFLMMVYQMTDYFASKKASCLVDEKSNVVINDTPVNEAAIGEFLSNEIYIVDEKLVAFRTTKAFRVFNGDGDLIGSVEEDALSTGAMAARMVAGKKTASMQKAHLHVKDINEHLIFSIKRDGITKPVQILDPRGNVVASLKSGTYVTPGGEKICKTKFKLIGLMTVQDMNGRELGNIFKKWNGITKTVLTTADKYMIKIAPDVSGQKKVCVLGAALIYEMIMGNK